MPTHPEDLEDSPLFPLTLRILRIPLCSPHSALATALRVATPGCAWDPLATLGDRLPTRTLLLGRGWPVGGGEWREGGQKRVGRGDRKEAGGRGGREGESDFRVTVSMRGKLAEKEGWLRRSLLARRSCWRWTGDFVNADRARRRMGQRLGNALGIVSDGPAGLVEDGGVHGVHSADHFRRSFPSHFLRHRCEECLRRRARSAVQQGVGEGGGKGRIAKQAVASLRDISWEKNDEARDSGGRKHRMSPAWGTTSEMHHNPGLPPPMPPRRHSSRPSPDDSEGEGAEAHRESMGGRCTPTADSAVVIDG